VINSVVVKAKPPKAKRRGQGQDPRGQDQGHKFVSSRTTSLAAVCMKLNSHVIVVYQVHACTKNACFIKSKYFSCSGYSTLTGADVRRGVWGWSNADRERGTKLSFLRATFMDGTYTLVEAERTLVLRVGLTFTLIDW